MSITSITYPAKCKDCHFHVRHWKGQKIVTKCMNGVQKVEEIGITRWTTEQKDKAKTITLRQKACDDFILYGTSEERVNELINERVN